MNLVVHRGTHQIGGCVTELRTSTTRIVIDMGAPSLGRREQHRRQLFPFRRHRPGRTL